MILMTEMVLEGESYEKSCDYRGDPGNVIDKLCSFLVILLHDSYDKSCDPKVILAGTLYFGNVYQCN